MKLLIIKDNLKGKGYIIVTFYIHSRRIRVGSINRKIDKSFKQKELFE